MSGASDTRSEQPYHHDDRRLEFGRRVLPSCRAGANAAEIINEAAMAMRFHATIEDFVDLLHVYPTMAEALKIAAIARSKDPYKLSCCAE
jgi:mercuric reductase